MLNHNNNKFKRKNNKNIKYRNPIISVPQYELSHHYEAIYSNFQTKSSSLHPNKIIFQPGSLNSKLTSNNNKLSYISSQNKKSVIQNNTKNNNNSSINNNSSFKENNNNPIKHKSKSCNDLPLFTNKPSLNKHSLRIANKLEPSINRLLKTKKRSISPCSQNQNYYSNSLNNYNCEYSQEQIKPTPKSFQLLYEKGIEHYNNIHQTYLNNKKEKENNSDIYINKPKINKNDSSFANNKKVVYKGLNYTKQSRWKEKILKANELKKIKNEGNELRNCTFTPHIEHLHIKNDEKIITKNIAGVNDYVKSRRRMILLKNQNENSFNNKKHINEFTITITKPKDFALSKSKTNSKNNSVGFHLINQSRKDYGTDEFFKNEFSVLI